MPAQETSDEPAALIISYEDWGVRFFRNVGTQPANYTELRTVNLIGLKLKEVCFLVVVLDFASNLGLLLDYVRVVVIVVMRTELNWITMAALKNAGMQSVGMTSKRIVFLFCSEHRSLCMFVVVFESFPGCTWFCTLLVSWRHVFAMCLLGH